MNEGKISKLRARREHILQLIFLLEFHDKTEREEQADLYRRLHMAQESEEFEFVKAKAFAIEDKLGEIDVILEKASTGWPLSRLGRSELSILRLAAYEILFDEEIPNGVAINEAVELGKLYGNDSAASFVNGVLAKLV